MTVPELTVAENLYLNRFHGERTIRWRALRERARELLAEYGVEVDPPPGSGISASSSGSSWRSPAHCPSAPG